MQYTGESKCIKAWWGVVTNLATYFRLGKHSQCSPMLQSENNAENPAWLNFINKPLSYWAHYMMLLLFLAGIALYVALEVQEGYYC